MEVRQRLKGAFMGSTDHSRLRVVVGEINPLDAECLSLTLKIQGDLEVVGRASTTRALVELTREAAPQVVVVEAGLPGTHGLRVVRQLRSACASAKILVILGRGYEGLVQPALRAGAHGVFSLEESVAELIVGIQRVTDQGNYLSPQVAKKALNLLRGQEPPPAHQALSKREFEVMSMLFEGQRVTDIAKKLGISIKTASTHKVHLFEKLGVATLKDLYLYVVEHGLFPPSHSA